jgi:hypothetical protein
MLKVKMKDDFKNLLEYREWVNNTFQHISELNEDQLERFEKENIESRIESSPKWYGSDTTYDELNNGITEYKKPELIEKLYDRVSDKLSTSVRDKIKARKVQYNPFGLGVFIFDRAAMGMYRLKEFHNPSLEKVVQQEEVRKRKNGFVLIKDGSPVIERWEQKPDGKPKIRTTTKNVYAYFPPLNKEKHAVDLFISCGGNASISAEQFLYSGISAIIVAQMLEKARIQTRISIVIGSSPDNFTAKAFGAVIPVKNYDEKLDINLLALLTSDPRFFRHEGFKGIISVYEHFGESCPSSLGYGFDKDLLMKAVEHSTYTKTAKLAPNRFYFGWTFNEHEAVDVINETINDLAEKLQEK